MRDKGRLTNGSEIAYHIGRLTNCAESVSLDPSSNAKHTFAAQVKATHSKALPIHGYRRLRMAPHADLSTLLLAEARKLPRLDADQERELVARHRAGDEVAFGQLIIGNVRHAINRAAKLRGYGLPEDDLIQEGIVGLLEASARFDISRDVPFGAYASWWIKATTMEFVLRNWSIVRTSFSTEQRTLFFKVRQLKARLMRDPTINPASVRTAIAAAVGVPVREVELMEARLTGDVYLNAPAPWDEDGEAEIGDNFADDSPMIDDLAFEAIDRDDKEIALQKAMAALDDQERLVVQERWLTDDVAPFELLGEFLGISSGRVKRIEIGALAKLQNTVLRQVAVEHA